MDDLYKNIWEQLLPNSDKSIQVPIPKQSLEDINKILIHFKNCLFPGVFYSKDGNPSEIIKKNTIELKDSLIEAIENFEFSSEKNTNITKQILKKLPIIKEKLRLDIIAIFEGDPAAKNLEEVILAYPSFEAIMIYRIAHELVKLELHLFGRILASIAHRNTGIDIHPNATIGHSFCIDHGTGVVIGETAIIGNKVKMYQGVTIGALSVSKSQQSTKRHPTIENNVTIYARTTILGGETIIGENSIIGGNVWLVNSVPKNSKIYNKDFKIEHS